jgi:hypothetical protein
VAPSRTRRTPGAGCLAVVLAALVGCGSDSPAETDQQTRQLSHAVTTPSGRRVIVTASPTTARSGGKSRAALCGRQRSATKTLSEINDRFCVYPSADGRQQRAVVFSGSSEPDLRIVASAPRTTTGIRLTRTGKMTLSGEVLAVPGTTQLRLALLTIPTSALPGTIELVRGRRVIGSARLTENPCEPLGRAAFVCSTPIELRRR